MLIKEILYSNDINKNKAIHLAQIILNSYIFIHFSEDLGLLPSETSTKTLMVPIENNNVDKNPLYRRLDELFTFVNLVKNIKVFLHIMVVYLKKI